MSSIDGASNLPGKEGLRLVAVLAHPDDETFIIGGALARYAGLGADVRVVYGPFGAQPDGSPSMQRQAELGVAANVLGIAGWSFLTRTTEGARTADVATLAAGIAAELRQLRPHVVVTFDATGGTGHVDHVAVGAATLQAVTTLANEATADQPPSRLYAAVFGRRQLSASLRIGSLARQGRDRGLRDALRFAKESQRPTAFIDVRSVLARRREAARCYTTALAEGAWWMRRWELLSPAVRSRLAPREVYSRLMPRMGDGEPPETGFFGGEEERRRLGR